MNKYSENNWTNEQIDRKPIINGQRNKQIIKQTNEMKQMD
jgi:hypothetical protein